MPAATAGPRRFAAASATPWSGALPGGSLAATSTFRRTSARASGHARSATSASSWASCDLANRRKDVWALAASRLVHEWRRQRLLCLPGQTLPQYGTSLCVAFALVSHLGCNRLRELVSGKSTWLMLPSLHDAERRSTYVSLVRVDRCRLRVGGRRHIRTRRVCPAVTHPQPKEPDDPQRDDR